MTLINTVVANVLVFGINRPYFISTFFYFSQLLIVTNFSSYQKPNCWVFGRKRKMYFNVKRSIWDEDIYENPAQNVVLLQLNDCLPLKGYTI